MASRRNRPATARRKGPWVAALFLGLMLALPSWVAGTESFNFRIIGVKENREAEELLQRVRDGEPFWKLALENSLLPNAPLGGYVEEARSDELREEFLTALASLASGEVSSAVRVGDHFAILKREAPWPSSNAWNRAEEEYGKAIRSGAQGDSRSARERVSEALTLYPEHQAALLTQRLLEGAPSSAAERSRLQLIFECLVSLKEKARSKAIETLERAARSASDAQEIQMVLGDAHMAEGQTPKAIAAYERALSSGRWASLVHARLGAAFLQQGDASKAQEHYQSVARLDVNSGMAHVGLGLVHVRVERMSEAMKELRLAVAIDPRLDPAHNLMGVLFMAERRLQGASWGSRSINWGFFPRR